MDSLSAGDQCAGESWRGVPRSPSHESVTTDLSLFSVSSAASDAKVLKALACKAGQGPDPSLRVASPNPDSKFLKRPSSALPFHDNWRSLLAGCAALCAALGMRRSFSAGDVSEPPAQGFNRGATSEVCLSMALEALSPCSRSCSTRAAAGGSQLISCVNEPENSHHKLHHRKVRQNYIRRRLLSTYRALERMSQSEFNLDKLEAAAASAVAAAVGGGVAPGPTTLAVPPLQPLQQQKHTYNTFVQTEAAHLALTSADLERERGRPLSKYERNMMIFNWLHTLDEAQPF